MSQKTICYTGFLGGPRSMGKVGEYLLKHLLARPGRYRTWFLPWKTDYMAGHWPPEINAILIDDPAPLDIDQGMTFCSIVEARWPRFARLTTPWIFYELSSLPESLVEDVNANDLVYVTSTFVQKVFLDHGVRVPVHILGHGIDPACYQEAPRTKNQDGPFDFLCIAEHTPRKNLPMLVRAFERAFPNDPGVRLVLKLGLHGEGDLRDHITRHEAVVLLTEDLATESDLVALYRRSQCFVLPTRAEGFGMPILEAMATGLPVIVSEYSGHMDFCTPDNSYLIHNRGLVDSDPDCFPFVASQWADPDEDHLVELMREVYHNYDRALAVGKRACHLATQEWTWDRQLAKAFP